MLDLKLSWEYAYIFFLSFFKNIFEEHTGKEKPAFQHSTGTNGINYSLKIFKKGSCFLPWHHLRSIGFWRNGDDIHFFLFFFFSSRILNFILSSDDWEEVEIEGEACSRKYSFNRRKYLVWYAVSCTRPWHGFSPESAHGCLRGIACPSDSSPDSYRRCGWSEHIPCA